MILTKTATCRPVDYIINCSMDKFTELLAFEGLSEEQATYCKDIRRRGKNKVSGFSFSELITFLEMNSIISELGFQIAAQNCRKRKTVQIAVLEEEVGLVYQLL